MEQLTSKNFSIMSLDDTNVFFRFFFYDRYHYKPNFSGNKHIHAHCEILFVTEGSGFFHVNNKKVPIQRGMVVICNNNVQHTESSGSREPLGYAIFGIKEMTLTERLGKENEGCIFLDFSNKYDFVFEFIQKIEQEYTLQKPFWQQSIQVQFNSFLLFILRSANLLALPNSGFHTPNQLANIELYLKSYYAEDITLDKLADLFCMSKYYLAHAFKKEYGQTIIEMLNVIRCKTARHLLQTSTFSISQIASNIGYNSSSYFSKTYKKIYGETPLQTRSIAFKKTVG